MIVGIGYHGLTTTQMDSMVDRVRRKHYGNAEGIIRCPPFLHSSEANDKLFLLFDVHVANNGKIRHIIGWGNQELIQIKKD